MNDDMAGSTLDRSEVHGTHDTFQPSCWSGKYSGKVKERRKGTEKLSFSNTYISESKLSVLKR